MKDYLVKIGLAILVLFAPVKHMILSALALTVADLLLGVYAAYKRKESITSAGLRRSVSKIFIYEVAICLAYIAEHFLMGDKIPISSIVAGFVGITEFKSCLENLDSISGDQLLKKLIDKIGSQNQ